MCHAAKRFQRITSAAQAGVRGESLFFSLCLLLSSSAFLLFRQDMWQMRQYIGSPHAMRNEF
jgi:hypothetical protein